MRTNDIIINVVYDEEENQLSTFAGEYRNLMMLIYDKIYTEDFGECKGMGRCGTCLIEIIEKNNEISTFERNEVATISKTGITGPNLRLACQILVDHSLHNIKIKVLLPDEGFL